MVEVVVPFGVSKASFLSSSPVELGVVAASKEGTEDAELHALFPSQPLQRVSL